MKESKMMRKLLVALQFSLVFVIAVAVPKPGAISGFDPQPDPPSAFGWVSPGAIRGFNPQPEPPGSIRGVSPQPIPPGTINGVSPQPSPPRDPNVVVVGDGSV
jgi:hypothetical protein